MGAHFPSHDPLLPSHTTHLSHFPHSVLPTVGVSLHPTGKTFRIFLPASPSLFPFPPLPSPNSLFPSTSPISPPALPISCHSIFSFSFLGSYPLLLPSRPPSLLYCPSLCFSLLFISPSSPRSLCFIIIILSILRETLIISKNFSCETQIFGNIVHRFLTTTLRGLREKKYLPKFFGPLPFLIGGKVYGGKVREKTVDSMRTLSCSSEARTLSIPRPWVEKQQR